MKSQRREKGKTNDRKRERRERKTSGRVSRLTSEQHRDRRGSEHYYAESEEEEPESVVGFGSEQAREDD